MYDENKLRAAMIASGNTPRQVSKLIGMPERTFYRKMKRGTWGLEEAKDIVKTCGLTKKQATDIFLS